MKNESPRLAQSSLARLKSGVLLPDYDRKATECGVVHFGPGVFFRAHVAWHLERLLKTDNRWGVCAVSLRTGALDRALREQDYLYTLAVLADPARFQIIGVLKEYLSSADAHDRLFARLIEPSVRLATLTVTEKGYCLDPVGGLDWAHPDIRHDIAGAGALRSVIGWLAEGLYRRRATGAPAFTVLSCDNLADNGPKLRQAVMQFGYERRGPSFAQWIENEVRFPATMVDSITPSSDDDLKDRVADATGLVDEAPVQREAFTQWIIEDALGSDAPDFAQAGAILTKDVALYEQAKLRLLNGAHSALAYVGLLAGCLTTAEAMKHPVVGALVEKMMREDSASTLRAGGGLDVQAYVSALINRFLNPAVSHSLRKIASDGSQKLPYRLLAPMSDLLEMGRPVDRLAIAVAAWMRFAIAEHKAGRSLDDPLATALAAAASACTGEAEQDAPRFLALKEVFAPALAEDPRFRAAIISAYRRLEREPLSLEL